MEARLATSVLATGLIRRAESQGGFGAVLAKGDPTTGSLLVILNEKGRNQRILERILQPDGGYLWQATAAQDIDNEGELRAFLGRRRKIDPDIWLIELDVASAERFAAEMNSED
jgi:hypothetical protein